MRNCYVIFCLFIFQAAFGQDNEIKKVFVWHNESLQSFFLYAKQSIPYIEFRKKDHSPLEIQPGKNSSANNQLVYDNWYSSVYMGHQYLFERDFGTLQTAVLQKKLDSLRRNDCYYNYAEGRIYADHIDIKLTSICEGESISDNHIFYKVDDRPGFLGGPAAFEQLVQSRLACSDYKSFSSTDSAIFLYAVVKKDSMAHEIKFPDSVQSPLRTIIRKSLVNTYGWKPYVKEGRNMNAWLQVFIYIHKDGTISADYIR